MPLSTHSHSLAGSLTHSCTHARTHFLTLPRLTQLTDTLTPLALIHPLIYIRDIDHSSIVYLRSDASCKSPPLKPERSAMSSMGFTRSQPSQSRLPSFTALRSKASNSSSSAQAQAQAQRSGGSFSRRGHPSFTREATPVSHEMHVDWLTAAGQARMCAIPACHSACFWICFDVKAQSVSLRACLGELLHCSCSCQVRLLTKSFQMEGVPALVYTEARAIQQHAPACLLHPGSHLASLLTPYMHFLITTLCML